jgi:gas vesicle protein
MGQSAEELREEIAGTRAELGDTLEAIGDRVSPGRVIERRKNRMISGIRSVKDRVMGTAEDAKDRVLGTATDAGGAVSDTASSALDSLKSAPETVRQRTVGNPLVAGAVAFGVGFLVAVALPPSEAEQQVAKKALDKAEPLKEQVARSGEQVADHLAGAAAEAVSEVKGAAVASGHEVAQTAQHAAEVTKEAAVDAARDVKDQATSS